jgi:hypothetical protein
MGIGRGLRGGSCEQQPSDEREQLFRVASLWGLRASVASGDGGRCSPIPLVGLARQERRALPSAQPCQAQGLSGDPARLHFFPFSMPTSPNGTALWQPRPSAASAWVLVGSKEEHQRCGPNLTISESARSGATRFPRGDSAARFGAVWIENNRPRPLAWADIRLAPWAEETEEAVVPIDEEVAEAESHGPLVPPIGRAIPMPALGHPMTWPLREAPRVGRRESALAPAAQRASPMPAHWDAPLGCPVGADEKYHHVSDSD